MRPVLAKLFNWLVIVAVALGFVTLMGAGLFAAYVVKRNIGYTELVSHTYEVRDAVATVRILTERIETARRGYLLDRDPQFLATLSTSNAERAMAIENFSQLVRDNPRQTAHASRLKTLTMQQNAAQMRSVAEVASGSADTNAAFSLDPAVELTRQLRTLMTEIDGEEVRLLAMRNAERSGGVNTLYLILASGGALLLVVGIGSLLVILGYTKQLTASRDELHFLNEGLEGLVNARTADLQRANDEIQRFAYIVSHDLRSPLVNVMGFTSELEAATKPLAKMLEQAEAQAPDVVTNEARLAVREDLPEAIGFIRGSTQKMDRLINAILQLSRQGRRVLAPAKVEMRGLFKGIDDNLKHISTELGAKIEIAPKLPDVVSDRLALEQIFSNLVENALKYLAPGRPGVIQISGEEANGRVIYAIADNGRGIDPRDHDRIFDLFRRSGAQDKPGEGIGLAHVRALAYRLGGTVSCESALDQGATFRVSLPPRISAEGAQA